MTRNMQGFTIPELLVVIAFLLVVAVGSAFLLRADTQTERNALAERQVAGAQLVQMLNKYHKDTGAWPASITTKPQPIGTEEGQINICKDLVPAYGKDLPLNPIIGIKLDADGQAFSNEPCTANIRFDAGFSVQKSQDGTWIILTAVALEDLPALRISGK